MEVLYKSEPPDVRLHCSKRETKVVGFFAYRTPIEIVCDEDACLIAGSEAAMRKYLSIAYSENTDRFTIKKTRFGEVVSGMYLGGSYAFDAESYGRFYALASAEGLPVSAVEPIGGSAGEIRFLTVSVVL